MRHAVVIELAGSNHDTYVPDPPARASVGDTLDEVKAEIREAIAFHIEGLLADGLPAPPPSSEAHYVKIDCGRELGLVCR